MCFSLSFQAHGLGYFRDVVGEIELCRGSHSHRCFRLLFRGKLCLWHLLNVSSLSLLFFVSERNLRTVQIVSVASYNLICCIIYKGISVVYVLKEPTTYICQTRKSFLCNKESFGSALAITALSCTIFNIKINNQHCSCKTIIVKHQGVF